MALAASDGVRLSSEHMSRDASWVTHDRIRKVLELGSQRAPYEHQVVGVGTMHNGSVHPTFVASDVPRISLTRPGV